MIARIVRARNAGRAIVDEARAAARRSSSWAARAASGSRRRRAIFGDTVDFVLKHAPIRVMVAAGSDGGMNARLPRAVVVFGAVAIALGFAILVRTALEGGGTVGFVRRRALRRARRGAPLPAEAAASGPQAPALQRVLDAPALASVAYGEIASSLYFALGVIALHALGFTPLVLGSSGSSS